MLASSANLACLLPRRTAVQSSLRVSPAVKLGQRGRQLTVTARAAAQPMDRLLAPLPYLLPFVDAWTYGRYLFMEFPAIRNAFSPLHGIIASYYNAGQYAPMIIFFALYLGVVQNKQFSSFVRFNAMQAVLLDVLLVLPRLLDSLITPPSFGWGAAVYKQSQSLVWIVVVAWIVATVVGGFLGKSVRIPFVAESADARL